MAALSSAALTVGVWLTAADTAGGGDKGALYASISAVAVAMIGGTVAVLTSRTNPRPPQEVTTYELPRSLVDLHEDERDRLIKERDRCARERDMWMGRAYEAGWSA